MINGSCLCGAVAYGVDAPLDAIVHCHCQTCRKVHGAAFSSVASVPREKFRRFCSRCGSQIVAERITSENVLLRLGCLDTLEAGQPVAHVWRSDCAAWYDPQDRAAGISRRHQGLTSR